MYKKILNHSPYVFLILTVVFLDQITKGYFIDLFSGSFLRGVTVLPFLNFVSAWNQGVSFGMFGGSEYSNIIFLCMSSAITLMLFVLLIRSNSVFYSILYSLIIGGAIGNITDRIKHGAVFDFIDLHIGGHHWPAFNLADSFVCIGALLLLLSPLVVKN